MTFARGLRSLGLLFFWVSCSQAATFYVGTDGDDSRSNGQAQNRSTPWRTIQRAVDQVNPGDRVLVLPGTYFEHVNVRRSFFVLQSEQIRAARIVGSLSLDDQAYIAVIHMDISNLGGSLNTKGIAVNRCHHITIHGNLVRDCIGGGIAFDQSDWIICEWNSTIANAFRDPAQHSGISVYQPQYRGDDATRSYGILIRNNISSDNRNDLPNANFGRPTDGNGIVLDDYFNTQAPFGNGVRYDRRTLVENNLCFNNGGNGIHCFLSQNINIRNNTCVNNVGVISFGGEISVSESERVYVYNNVVEAFNRQNAVLQFQSREFFFFSNLISGRLQGLSLDSSNIQGPPLFRPGTVELESFSPAVNAGIDLGDHFFLDVFGRPRFNGQIDMGAIESN